MLQRYHPLRILIVDDDPFLLKVLGLLALPLTLNRFAGPGLSARGQAGTMTRLGVLQLALTIVISAIAAPYGHLAKALQQQVGDLRGLLAGNPRPEGRRNTPPALDV